MKQIVGMLFKSKFAVPPQRPPIQSWAQAVKASALYAGEEGCTGGLVKRCDTLFCLFFIAVLRKKGFTPGKLEVLSTRLKCLSSLLS